MELLYKFNETFLPNVSSGKSIYMEMCIVITMMSELTSRLSGLLHIDEILPDLPTSRVIFVYDGKKAYIYLYPTPPLPDIIYRIMCKLDTHMKKYGHIYTISNNHIHPFNGTIVLTIDMEVEKDENH